MFAVVETGGKQYWATPDQIIKVEKIEANQDSIIELKNVLMVQDSTGNTVIGKPNVERASVKAQIVKQMKDEKVIVFKKHRRHNYRRKRGHRQNVTLLKILEISLTK